MQSADRRSCCWRSLIRGMIMELGPTLTKNKEMMGMVRGMGGSFPSSLCNGSCIWYALLMAFLFVLIVHVKFTWPGPSRASTFVLVSWVAKWARVGSLWSVGVLLWIYPSFCAWLWCGSPTNFWPVRELLVRTSRFEIMIMVSDRSDRNWISKKWDWIWTYFDWFFL